MRPELTEGFLETGIITPSRMRAVDKNAIALGVTELQMMESAGKSLAEFARATKPARVLVICGRGNNGGTGWLLPVISSRVYRLKSAILIPENEHCRANTSSLY